MIRSRFSSILSNYGSWCVFKTDLFFFGSICFSSLFTVWPLSINVDNSARFSIKRTISLQGCLVILFLIVWLSFYPFPILQASSLNVYGDLECVSTSRSTILFPFDFKLFYGKKGNSVTGSTFSHYKTRPLKHLVVRGSVCRNALTSNHAGDALVKPLR